MKKIVFRIHLCGMSEKTFSKKIMIYKPFNTVKKVFSIKNCNDNGIVYISDLINFIVTNTKDINSLLGDYGTENFNYRSIYIRHKDYLLGLQKDEPLKELFAFFKSSKIEIDYISVLGGASIHCNGYMFIIHPNEEIHKYQPHVHVIKNGISVRYSLDTFERFEHDTPGREHQRDEKKIIIPTIKKNQNRLYDFWNKYMNGYIPPAEDENGKQYYKES